VGAVGRERTSSTVTRRLVLTTESAMVLTSSGRIERRLITSALIPSCAPACAAAAVRGSERGGVGCAGGARVPLSQFSRGVTHLKGLLSRFAPSS
jgi:hypothetical protein